VMRACDFGNGWGSARSAYRDYNNPNNGRDILGFRIVRNQPQQ